MCMHALSSCNPVLKPCMPKGIACLYNDKNTIVTLPTPPIEYLSQQPSDPANVSGLQASMSFLNLTNGIMKECFYVYSR